MAVFFSIATSLTHYLPFMKSPRAILLVSVLFSAAIFSASCTRDDSIDPPTPNDIADALVGNYTYTDTANYTDPGNGQSVTQYRNGSASISKLGPARVRLNGFSFQCGASTDTTAATVSETTLVIEGNPCPISTSIVIRRTGTALTYTFNQDLGTTNNVRGRAEKQP